MSKNNKISLSDKKFKIKELIECQHPSLRKIIRQDLINQLGVSERTFERILYAKKGSKQEISATNLIIIANYFDIDPRTIIDVNNIVFFAGSEFVLANLKFRQNWLLNRQE